MVKNFLTGGQVSDVAYIDECAGISRELTRMKSRGTGDTDNAMRAIEREYGIDYWTTWQLRYRRSRIRSLAWDVVERIKAAYEAERQSQINKLRSQQDKTKAARGSDYGLVVSTQTLLGREKETEGDAPGLPPECSD